MPITREQLYSPIDLQELFDREQPDYIFHLASFGNLASQEDISMTILANIIGTMNMLQASLNVPYKAFINFSSSSVTLPYETFYSASKRATEGLVKAFVNEYDKFIVSVRPFSVIGEHEQAEHLIPTLIRSCQTGEEMSFIASPKHDFIGVKDFISAVLIITEKADKLKGKVIPIGTGKNYSNEEILKIVENVTNREANIKRITHPIRKYDTKDWVCDPTIIKQLGWKQTQTIEKVIKTMI